MKIFSILVRRDLRLLVRRSGDSATVLLFFIVVASLFPLALGTEPDVLRRAGPGLIWITALLASLLSLEALYHRDFEDGSLDLMLLSPLPPLCIVLAKMTAHWGMTGLPLLAASMLVAQMFLLPAVFLPGFILSLLAGTFYMSLLGGMGAFLTAGARRPGVLLALVVLPLYVPMLILGVMAASAGLAGNPAKPYLLLQAALLTAALPLALLASSALLKMHLRSN